MSPGNRNAWAVLPGHGCSSDCSVAPFKEFHSTQFENYYTELLMKLLIFMDINPHKKISLLQAVIHWKIQIVYSCTEKILQN